MKQLKDVKDLNIASSLDIIVNNQTEIEGPLTINLHLAKDQKPIKVVIEEKESISTNSKTFESGTKTILIIVGILIITFLIATPSTTSNILTTETKSTFRIVSREEWEARPPVESEILNVPVHRVIVAHTATAFCNNQESCSYHLRNIQNFHMESRSLNDIIFNFLIGGDGNIYEGRGWNIQSAHTKGFNEDSICVAFMGTFKTIKPSDIQLEAGKRLLEEGVRINKLVKDYRLYGARQLTPTESPGKALYEIIKEWPHWSNITS